MRVSIELTQCQTEGCQPKEEKITEDITWMEDIIFQAILKRHPPIGIEAYDAYEELVHAISITREDEA